MDTERTSVPAVRPGLAAACPALTDGTADDAVAGVVPAFVASPSSTEEASALLRTAAGAGLAVVPRGAGGHVGPDHRGDLPAASAAGRGGVGDGRVRPGRAGRGGGRGGRGGGLEAGAVGGGAGLAGRVAAAAARRGAARGHRARRGRT